jgi:hypothetical protein
MRAGHRALLGLLLCTACARTPAQAPLPPAPAAIEPRDTSAFLVRESTLEDGALTVHVEIPLQPPGRKPAVISLIGGPHTLLGSGFVVATYSIDWTRLKGKPPPSPPANTVGTWVLASPSAQVLGQSYLEEIAATATEHIPRVIDYLQTVPEVDPARIGMVGGSTNGFITLQAVAADRRIRAAVVLLACGDYHRFLRFSSMGMEGAPLDLAPSYEAWLRRQEPIEHPHRLVHAAILLVIRSEDPIIPVSCADETATVLTRAFARAGASDRFRYVRLEQSGHGIASLEWREAMPWLQRWLLGP